MFPGIPDRQEMQIRRVAQLFDDLKRGRLLARDPVGIDRVHDREIVPLPRAA